MKLHFRGFEQVPGKRCISQKMKEINYRPLGKKKKSIQKSHIKILKQGLYNCTALQA